MSSQRIALLLLALLALSHLDVVQSSGPGRGLKGDDEDESADEDESSEDASSDGGVDVSSDAKDKCEFDEDDADDLPDELVSVCARVLNES